MVCSKQAEREGYYPSPAPGIASDLFAPGNAWAHFMSTQSIDNSLCLLQEVIQTHEQGVPMSAAILGIVGSAERWKEIVNELLDFICTGEPLELVD